MEIAQQRFSYRTASWGELAVSGALVRSECQRCGLQHHVNPLINALCFGTATSPINTLAKCTVVGCDGMIFYLALPPEGGEWIALLRGDKK
ncbi:hypothetical protein [Caenibius sp. WL]|uniref:hypothetical protein n=1 Tax=Caenibius sp. WL TaxID=2872646 RepID=UPI001C99E07A|nr:hypothetical protein [Caenibius sp. WL]QZP07642.1 hypothetical protein K5X80_13375 [Caenibius sp. WL]